MRLPKTQDALSKTLSRILDQCEVSRADRMRDNRTVRNFVLYGADNGQMSRYNKIYHNLRLKSSFLYSNRTVRFAITAPPGSSDAMMDKTTMAADALTRAWRQSNAGRQFSQQVFWSLAYGSMLAKYAWIDGLHSWSLEPSQFGVLREENPVLSDQEACSMRFFSSKAEIERALLAQGVSLDKVKQSIKRMSAVEGGIGPLDKGSFLGRVIVSQVSPTYQGSVPGLMAPKSTGLDPRSSEELVEMREIRVWDDDMDDYRVFTIALPDVVIFNTPSANLDVSGELPFVNLTPNPLYDYFWGVSEGRQLIPLQKWREKRMDQLDTLFTRQIKPPGFAKNMTGLTDEKYAAAFRKGGIISAQMPNAELTPLYPQLPPESFAEINAIDSMFDATLGIPPVLQGQNPVGGGRGESGMNVMIQMASAPILNQALEVEAALEKAGDIVFRLMRRHDDTVLTDDKGEHFTLGLLPEDCQVTVAAHSSSPLFSSDQQAMVNQMFEAGLIDGVSYLELTDPPMADTLIERFKDRENQQKQLQEEHQKIVLQAVQQSPPADRATILANLFEALHLRTPKKK